MKALYRWVNLIPVIAACDKYTVEEIVSCKKKVIAKAREVGIKFFDFG